MSNIDKDALAALLFGIAPFWIIVSVISYRLLRRVNGLSFWPAIGAVLVFTGFAASMLLYPTGSRGIRQPWMLSTEAGNEVSTILLVIVRILFVGALPMLGIPFVGMLCQKWLGSRLTAEEQNSGTDGVRAWLRPTNLLWIAVIMIGLWLWTGKSLLLLCSMLLLSLLVYPLFRWANTASQENQVSGLPADAVPPIPGESLREERDQVLRMVAEQKITPEDGAQLLSALAATVAVPQQDVPQRSSVPMDLGRRLSLAGMAVVTVGFFLPWFKVDAVAEISKMMADAQAVMGNVSMPQFKGLSSGPNQSIFAAQLVRGADLWPAWILLALIVTAVCVGITFPDIRTRQRRIIETASLAGAGFLFFYYLAVSIQHIQFGLVIVLVGILLTAAGLLRRSPRRLV